jgi:redox-sensitive bicupin YhaK (pirin superfamily)
MINIIKNKDRYYADHGWLKTYWHFSFGDYFEPKNMNWSKLRVFNDDVVEAGGGFDFHPHRNMEIITYVLSGQLAHQDSVGNAGVVHPGEVQVMSAGKGIYHAEHNASKSEPVALFQIWIEPRHQGNTPRWEQKQFKSEQRLNKLLPVVSGGNVSGTLAIDQDAAVYVSTLQSGKSVSHQNAGKHAYLFVRTGDVTVNGQKLAAGDQARIANEPRLDLTAGSNAELILLDLP